MDLVGGKNASLGEMINKVDVPVPPGFALTSKGYDLFIQEAGIKDEIREIIESADLDNVNELREAGSKVRKLIKSCDIPEELRREIEEKYRELSERVGTEDVLVAVRSSATAEDLPSISAEEPVLVRINGSSVFGTMEEIGTVDCKKNYVEVPAMNDGEVEWRGVEEIIDHEAKDDKLYEITTVSGRRIRISKDHSLITLNEKNMEPRVTSIEDLERGEKVPVTEKIPIRGNYDDYIYPLDYIEGEKIEKRNDEIFVRNNSENWKIQNTFPVKIPADKNLAYFLGIYVSEGSTYNSSEISITNTSSEVLDRVIKFMDSIDLWNSQRKNKHSYRFYCKALVKFLHEVAGKPDERKGKGKLSKNKEVPDFVFDWDEKLIGEFLKGCFDGDGSVEKNGITYTTVSKMLASGILKLLEMMGISCTLRRRGGKGDWSDSIEIRIPASDGEKFKEKIGFESDKKRKLKKLIQTHKEKSYYPQQKHTIEVPEELSEKIKKKFDQTQETKQVKRAECPSCNSIINKSSKFDGKERWYCPDCGRAYYREGVDFVEKKVHKHWDSKGRFKEGMNPWNKGRVSGTFSHKEFNKRLEELGIEDVKFPDSILWDEIEEVKTVDYTGTVHDFSVPNVENFSAGMGGIITHNSASFAGQQETYLNVSGADELIEATKKCIASLFTDRAISYREDKGFDHFKVKLSVGVQEMVQSESAGVMFSIDPDSGFENVVYINGSWGLGETVVGGEVNPDEYIVFKPTKKLISKEIGDKKEMITREGGENVRKETSQGKRDEYVISDEEAEELAEYGIRIHDYYERPMDIEWAKDRRNDELYILQARPETVHSQKDKKVIQSFRLKEESEVICEGQAIGRMIGSGKVNVIIDADEIDQFEEGQVLVTDMTDPDWEPIMKIASAIVTEKGGSTSHAAIVSRELGIPAVVGTEDAASKLETGQDVTVDCTTGDGRIMRGKLDFEIDERNIEEVPETETQVMMNVGVPSNAFDHGQYPVKGVGLARQEFVVGSWIGEHPLHIKEEGREDEFINKLSYGLAQIAAGFYPRPVIVRLSDFKSNEYANMEGGEKYEPNENNPMIGWRGASRYTDPEFKEAFEMECEALKRVRDGMGLTNVKIMIPFCRTLKEAEETMEIMAENGLERGENDLEVYMMAEIPSNVILAEEFAEKLDGFSIGSNDLTQLTLGVDRDNQKLQEIFDERNEAVKESVRNLIERAHKHGTKTGICGDAPSSIKGYAEFLVKARIDSISVTPDVALKTIMKVKEAEEKLRKGS